MLRNSRAHPEQRGACQEFGAVPHGSPRLVSDYNREEMAGEGATQVFADSDSAGSPPPHVHKRGLIVSQGGDQAVVGRPIDRGVV